VLQASLVSCGAALLPSVHSFAQKGASRLPAWRNGMPVNQFSPIPGTAPNLAVGMPPEWQKQVINDYCGLQTDETRGVLYSSLAGGHASTKQNGVYKIDIMQNAPKWSTLRASSDVSNSPVGLFYLRDGRPASRHTYYAGHVVDIAGSPVIIHACMMAAQAGGGGGSQNSMQTDAFHIDRNDWDAAGTWPNMPGEIGSIFAKCVSKDPRTQFIWAIDGSRGGLISYLDPVARKWTPVNGNLNNWGAAGASLIDTKRNRFVIAGSASYVANPHTPQAVHDPIALGMMNLSTYAYQDMGLTGTGKPAFNGEVGFVHATSNDRYLVIEGVTGRITSIHPTTGDCKLLTTAVPAAIGHVEGRCAFIPALEGVVYLPSFTDTLYFMPAA
jgi:hypothetical protein